MRWFLFIGLALAAGLRADTGTTNTPPGATGYIEKFEVPERDDQGNLKWKLSGDRAAFRADGLIDVYNARAEFYQSNRVSLVFTTPICVLDRLNQRAATDAPVRVERDNLLLTGIGGEWFGTNGTVNVRSNVQMQITGTRLLPEMGAKP